MADFASQAALFLMHLLPIALMVILRIPASFSRLVMVESLLVSPGNSSFVFFIGR
jgi:hypothetical protein